MNPSHTTHSALTYEAWRETQGWYIVSKDDKDDPEHGVNYRLMNIAAHSAWDDSAQAERTRLAHVVGEAAHDAAMRYANGHPVNFEREILKAIWADETFAAGQQGRIAREGQNILGPTAGQTAGWPDHPAHAFKAPDDDFPLPPACPLRNEGDDTCEACQ